MTGNEAPGKDRPHEQGGQLPTPSHPHTPITGDVARDEGSKPWTSNAPTGSSDPDEHDIVGMMSVTTVPVRKLGSGGQGDVVLVEHLGQLEAHKVLRVGRGREREVFREALHTRRVVHPNIVKVFGIEKVGDVPVLRMEYVEGRNLGQVVDEDGVFAVERLVPLAMQVADALSATHEREIVHHDLKPSNIILRKDGRTVVVTDFGVSAALRTGSDGSRTAGRGGTPYFMAPELHEPDGRGTIASDIWSLGVTLYFLVSGIYPFPFGDSQPGEAVKKPPRDVTRSHRYVAPEFWAIVRRMLRDDPSGARYESMREVRDDLEAYALSIVCPDCQGRFRLESVSGMCPEPSCHGTRIASMVEVKSLRRTAETALADCAFDEAARGFDSAAKVAGASGDAEVADRCAKLAEAVDGLRSEHDTLLTEARDLFGKERDIDCVRRIHAARVRFSRSAPLKALRIEVRERIHALFKATETLVMQSVRKQDFRAARDVLTRMDHIMGDPFTRSELAHSAGEKLADFQWLYQEVEKKELAFNSYTARAREKIEAFDFAKAQREYTRLETEFPSEQHVRMLSALRNAALQYELATSLGADELQRILDDPYSLATEGKEARLAAAAQGCRELLEGFPVDVYPSFDVIRQVQVLAEQASEAVRLAARSRIEAAGRAREAGSFLEELSLLGEVQTIIARTDLFEARERDELEARCKSLRSQSRKVESLYGDAETALRNREYARAHAALAELAALVPEDYRDMAGLRAEVDRIRAELAALKEHLAKEFSEIDRGRFNLDTATAALRHAEKLYTLSDNLTRRTQVAEIGGVAVKLFLSQRDYLQGDGDVADDGVVPFLRETFVPVARSLPEARWQAICEISPELCRALCSLFDTALRRGVDAGGLAMMLPGAESLAGLATTVRPLLAVVTPPAGSTHPAVRLASLVAERYADATRAEQERLAERASALIESLVECCPPIAADDVRLHAASVARVHAAAARARRLGRTMRVASIAVPTLLAVAAAAWFGWRLGAASVDSGLAEEVRAALLAVTGESDLRTSVLDGAGKDTSGLRGSIERLPLLARWTSLGHDLARLTDDAARLPPDERERLRRAVAARVPQLAFDRAELDRSWPWAIERFDADLKSAVIVSVERMLESATRALASEHPGDAVDASLLAGMTELESDLGTPVDGGYPVLDAMRRLAEHVRRGLAPITALRADVRGAPVGDLVRRVSEARSDVERSIDDARRDTRSGFPPAVWDEVERFSMSVLRSIVREALLIECHRAASGGVVDFATRARGLLDEARALGTTLPRVRTTAHTGLEAAVSLALETVESGARTADLDHLPDR